MYKISFSARGRTFHPNAMALTFAASFEPGSVATFGGNRGTTVPYGAALYSIPGDLPHSDTESEFAVAFRHLQALIPEFRAAGAEEFTLHLHRQFSSHCNEEFTREELRLLASLDCHLFYEARNENEMEA